MQRHALPLAAAALALLASAAPAARAAEVAFYVVAHEDDWQLFYSRNVYADSTQPAQKMVFVYLTAGDSGDGAGPAENPYYLAREEGAVRAVRFLADMGSAMPGPGVSSSPSLRGHVLSRYAYRNTVSYFLRLPDGFRDGSGFSRTGRASLQKLRSGAINQLSAVDGSATYLGFRDLVDTLEALVREEAAGSGAQSVWLNIPDSSAAANPNDHSDHANSGFAMDAVAVRLSCANVARFVGHHTAKLPENLSAAETANQSALYAVTASAIGEVRCSSCVSQWRHHRMWFGRSYFRVTPGDGSNCIDTGASHRATQSCLQHRHRCPSHASWDEALCKCTE